MEQNCHKFSYYRLIDQELDDIEFERRHVMAKRYTDRVLLLMVIHRIQNPVDLSYMTQTQKQQETPKKSSMPLYYNPICAAKLSNPPNVTILGPNSPPTAKMWLSFMPTQAPFW